MTRQEFIDRTGFTPTEDHFKAIHEEYMAAGVGVDKDTFCERWLKNNGPQQVYDWMRGQADRVKKEIAVKNEILAAIHTMATITLICLKEDDKLPNTYKHLAKELKKELNVLKVFVIQAKYMSEEHIDFEAAWGELNKAMNKF